MRQWNNVTDHTLEVDRDQDRIRAQEETSEGGLCAPVLTYWSPFRRSTVKIKRCNRIWGKKQLETCESWLQYCKAVTCCASPNKTNQTIHKKGSRAVVISWVNTETTCDIRCWMLTSNHNQFSPNNDIMAQYAGFRSILLRSKFLIKEKLVGTLDGIFGAT